jgi:hypothetical protein
MNPRTRSPQPLSAQSQGEDPVHNCDRSIQTMRQTIFLAVWLMLLTTFAEGTETVTITNASGAKATGPLKSWSADILTLAATSEQKFARSDVRSISFHRPPQNLHQGRLEIWLSNGDRISARAVTAANDLLTVSWPILNESDLSKISLEKVLAIILEWPDDSSERLRLISDLQTLPPGNDLVVLANGDRSLGEFERLDAAHVELKIGAKPLKLDRSRARAIRFNPELTTIERPSVRRMILTLTDGSQLTISSMELLGDVFNVKSLALGTLSLPASSLVNCHVFGDRLIPVSDYEPAQVEFTPYLTSTWPLVRNANVRRGRLKLRGVESVVGLGMHSRMVVKYDLKGREQEFRATVGIDDIGMGKGSVIFAVDLDGTRVWTSPELTGESPAMTVPPIELRGKKQFTLIVEYGEFADVSDYANWCDAVFIVDPAS